MLKPSTHHLKLLARRSDILIVWLISRYFWSSQKPTMWRIFIFPYLIFFHARIKYGGV